MFFLHMKQQAKQPAVLSNFSCAWIGNYMCLTGETAREFYAICHGMQTVLNWNHQHFLNRLQAALPSVLRIKYIRFSHKITCASDKPLATGM